MSIDSSNPTRPKASWIDVVLTVFLGIVALFGSQLIAGFIISLYPLIRHWSVAQGNSWLTNSIFAQFIFVLLAETIAVGVIIFFLKKTKRGLSSIGLRRPAWTDPIFGLMGLPAYFVIYFVLVNIVIQLAPHLNVNEKQQIGFTGASGAGNIILTFISLVILPPIAEEIIFRGLIYSNLRKKMKMWLAAIITSLLFAAGHLPEGGSAGPLYIAAIDTFSLSLVLVYLREKTGGLYASMTLHALKNLIAFIALFALHQL